MAVDRDVLAEVRFKRTSLSGGWYDIGMNGLRQQLRAKYSLRIPGVDVVFAVPLGVETWSGLPEATCGRGLSDVVAFRERGGREKLFNSRFAVCKFVYPPPHEPYCH